MHIRWTDAAVRDFTQICDYISERGSAVTARRVALSVYQGVDILAKFPESGRTGRQPETRGLVFTGYHTQLYTAFAEKSSRFFVSYTGRNSGRKSD